MPVYRGPGGAGDATNDATVTAVQAAATSAATSATNAANSATAAANSATGSATSATNASNSATTAAGRATTAAGHATNASTFATNSSLSATDSADSATEAEGYASQANDSEVAASASASAAATSATNAGTSATNSAASAASALAIYGNTTAMNNAVTAAQLAETNAETAETNAETAATTATNAASTATTQAAAALVSANNADADATAASIDANEAQAAATAAQAAVSSATAIYGSITDIQQAEANSEANRNAAATSATNASNSASTATTQAGIATTQANNAATSAAAASAVALGNEPVRHSVRPSLLLDFANTKTLDPRITFTRASTATYYDGKTVAKAEENLVIQSQFASSWSGAATTLTVNTTTAPDGTTTAATATPTTASALHFINTAGTIQGNVQTHSVFVKANGYTKVGLREGGTTGANVTFDLSTVAVISETNSSPVTISNSAIVSVGSGWYRISTTFTGAVSQKVEIWPLSSAYTSGSVTGVTFAGDGTSGVFLWGAQAEQRSSVTAYTPTTTAPITNYVPVLLSAPNNVSRFEHNPVTGESLGLEIEEQRTNLVTYSEDFSNAFWTKNALTITANTIVAPDGTLTSDKFVENTANASHTTQTTLSVTAGTAYTFSVYAKAAENTWILLATSLTNTGVYFNLSTGTLGTVGSATTAQITSVGNGWYRCSITFTETTTGNRNFFIYTTTANNVFSHAGNGWNGTYIWGAQLEAGAFATSYVPTVASQVTRSADAASMTGTNFSSWYRADEGTIYAESFIPVNVDSSIGNYYLAICDGTFSNSIMLADVGATTALVWNGGSVQFNRGVGGEPTTFAKMSFAYRSNDFIFCVNAALSSAGTSGRVPVVDRLLIGVRGDSSSESINNGSIKKIAYYAKKLTNAELQGLTTV